ncbi:MAG: thioredoxin-dependent thiol peroxidase [Saprospiraceae bacterium]
MITLKVGDKAPFFSAPIETGKIVNLDEFKGKKLVLFFYPKDNTPGCTAEACSLKESYSELKMKGFELLGISADDEKSHQKFIDKFNLPYSLIADTSLKMLNDYGVWGPKKFMGKEYDGIHRTTFVVDENGLIERIFEKVVTSDHAAQIMDSYN